MSELTGFSHFLSNVPSETRVLLADIVDSFRDVLGDNLIGLYLHGSLAMGCFNPSSSDIDFIVVVNEPLDIEAKQAIVWLSLELSESASNGLEFSIVLVDTAQHFTYPTPYELHYSRAWDERFRTGEVDFETQLYDKDLAAHFTIIRHRGICLYGASRKEVFSEVPTSDYLDSIAEDARLSYQNIMGGPDEGQCLVPPYAVLNFCRVLAFIEQGLITSKREGGQWGIEHLSEAYRPIIQAASDKYTAADTADTVALVDCAALKAFARYAMAIINDAQK